MTERSDDLQRSRHEAALLLRLDPQNLSPSDALRCDLVATLRLSIDSAQADALEGRAADLGRLIVATESLVKLLPSEPPQPASRGPGPREIMLETYKAMRARGAAFGQGYDGLKLENERLRARVAELEAAGAPAPVESTATPPAPAAPAPASNNVVKLPPRTVDVNALPPAEPEPWRAFLGPDGTINPTPGRKYWGPA